MQTFEIAKEISSMSVDEMQLLIREMLFISEQKANTLAFLLETELIDKIDYTL